MKIAFDVDVLAKQMPIKDYVRKVADWGYKYIEQSPHPRINPFYKHPLLSLSMPVLQSYLHQEAMSADSPVQEVHSK